MKFFMLLNCCFLVWSLQAQSLTVQSFGNPKNEAVLFLHGGPGYNSVVFEQTTAEALAAAGFFVLSYDRRGEGRSATHQAAYTFAESIADINQILAERKLDQINLLGHSFGGMLASYYAAAHPEKVKAVVLIGAPIALQESFKTIIASSKARYEQRKDEANLQYIQQLVEMDTASLAYSSYCFMHAMQNGFYTTQVPTEDAQRLFPAFATDSLLQKYARQMDYQSPSGFWKNEQYTTLDLRAKFKVLQAQKIKLWGIYGREDGLYAPAQIEDLKQLLGSERVVYWEHCSHNVFMDQQKKFIQQLQTWLQ